MRKLCIVKYKKASLLFILSIFALFILSQNGIASSFMPIVSNFSANEYKAGLQNWCCSQGSNGEIYIGNNKGLLRYDGYFWEKYQMPGNLIVRSVLADSDRVYVGAYEEFGYFSANEYGQMEYHSLRNMISTFKMHEDEIWNIIKVKNKIYFQSFSSWFLYDGKTVTPHYDSQNLPLYFHKVNDSIYVQMVNGDLYKLDGDHYEHVLSRKEIGDDAVVAILPGTDNSIILCTEWHGLWNFDGTKVSRRATDIDAELFSQQANRATILKNDSTIVIGTIKNGVYAIDQSGKMLWHGNVNSLCNNSVLGLFTDRNNNIWVALDNGLSLIHTGTPYSILKPDKNDLSLGMVYGIDRFEGKIYIATNQGAYYFNPETEKIQPIANTEGQNWYISHFDNSQMIVGNNANPKWIVDNRAANITGTNSGSTCIRHCQINGQDILLESSYTGFRVYKKSNNVWQLAGKIEGFDSPVRQFEVDHTGTIWASHMNSGIFKIELNKDLTKVENSTSSISLPQEIQGGIMFVMKIRGRVVLSCQGNFYTYDDISGKLVPFDQLNDLLHENVHSAQSVDDNTYWLSTDNGYIMICYEKEKYIIKQFVPAQFFNSECNETNNNAFIDNENVYFPLNNAVVCYNGDDIKSKHSRLRLSHVFSTDRNKKKHIMLIDSKKSNREKAFGDITFRLSYPYFSCSPVKFKYHISGGKMNLDSESPEPTITYGSLGYGDYHFTATVVNDKDETIDEIEYYFCVPTPFYLSVFAIMIYISILALLIYFYVRWRTAKIMAKRKKIFEAEKVKQELKMIEQQRIIDRQQQQLLELELSNKGKEIASLTMDLFAKDRVIDSLRGVMSDKPNKKAMSQQDVESVLKQLNTSNIANPEFWDVYQKNFDLIHENFFRNLRQRYPSLTSSDLKFCAFLRLNLSTKDIAQITNLTVRGIEAARYRLRKKLDLPEGASLVDFFIDFR